MHNNFYKDLIRRVPFAYAHLQRVACADNRVDYCFKDLNPRFEQVCGLTSREILGKTVSEIIARRNVTPFDWIHLAQEISAEDAPHSMEYFSEITNKWYKLDICFIEKNEFSCIFTDITAEKETVAELDTIYAMYRCHFDKDWTMHYIGPQIEAICGHPPADFINNNVRSFESIIYPSDRQLVAHEIKQAIAKNTHWNLTYRLIHRNGQIRWVHEKGRAIKNNADGIAFLEGFIHDITSRKLREEALTQSEAKWKSYVEHAPYGVFVTDKSGKYIEVNPMASQLTGYSPSELLQMHISDLIPPGKRIPKPELFQQLLQNGFAQGEGLFQTKDGQERIWTIAATKISDERLIAFCEDITERRQQEEKWRFYMENSPLGISVANQQGQIIEVNRAFEQITGYRKQEITQMKDLFVLFPAHAKEAAYKLFEKQLKGELALGELEIIRKNGEQRYLMLGAHVIDNLSLAFAQDITELKIAEKEKQEMQKQMFHSARLADIGTLAAGVAHEINNPLTIIKGFIELLSKRLDCQHLLETFKKVDFAAERIKNIVTGLRTFARAESNLIETINLHKIIQEAVNLVRVIYEKENISIQTTLLAHNANINANVEKIHQVVMNFLSNGKDAIKELRDVGTIHITTRNDQANLVLSITDDGIGMDNEQKEKVFNAFYTTKNSGQGTGLGLSIAHQIVKSFAGNIDIVTQKENGSTFIVTLPLATKEISTQKPSRTKKASSVQMRKALIVDDEEDIRLILQRYLEQMEINVSQADDGQKALALLQQEYFDYIFTDIKMPKMSGDQLLHKAITLPHLKTSKFIIITGGIDTDYSDQQREHLHSKASGCITKPFSMQDVIDSINALTD